jgi:predicted transcriptional regulator
METKVLAAHVPLPLAEKEERRRWTLEALADVDAGQVIDHQAVQAWADSLDTDNPLPLPR